MIEESRNTENTGAQEQPAQEQSNTQNSMSEDSMSALNALEGLVPTPVKHKEEPVQETEQQTEEVQQTEEIVDENQSVEATQSKEQTEALEDLTIESPIFGEKGLKLQEEQEQSENQRIPENAEEIQSFLKENFGYEDLNAFKSEYESMKDIKAQFNEVQGQNEQLSSVFKEMPSDLYNMVDRFVRGENWKELAKQVKNFDYSKDANDQDPKDLLDHYASGKVTSEEWEEYTDPDGDPTVKKAVEAYLENSRSKFDREKEEASVYHERLAEQSQESEKRFAESIDKTVSNLSSQIEGIDEGYVKKVSEELRQNDFNNLFLNKDGSLREDAAARYAMAKDGLELVSRLQHAARVKTKNEERQEILSRGADKPNARGTKSQVTAVRPEIKTMLEGIEALGNNKNTY